ncbi:type I 3-dehydroquinate dehydratase [Lactococcus termiticola]|uniref:3-dehydroquinate dehydratase n=1 Tax=Lactococcus termiticola TaxID=2169526 RepID=A0A2R5HJ73_9LACT|nr:type I 3-dehydroquinate dehydratase [Lactococcus termiticola]GBG96221.1 3-dehydroquinate dehydratase [Lactococcus termiticola]
MYQSKIVVPIMPKCLKDLEALEAQAFSGADIIEWRADYLPSGQILEAAPIFLEKFQAYETLVTIRTRKEGGELEIDEQDYIRLLHEINKLGPSYLDVEYFTHERAFGSLRDLKDKIVLSYHNFQEMPTDFTERLFKMEREKTAFVKMAVMPQQECDVLDIMQITRDMTLEYGQKFITVGMGELGKLSRISGYLTGNAWTFASLEEASAPGQLSLKDTAYILDLLEKNVRL